MSGETDIIEKLAANMPTYSKRQRNIARYICDNCDKAAFMTAEMLSNAAGVSESTVVRFATELGYEGYPGFRRALQQVLRQRLAGVHESSGGGEGMAAEILRQSLDADAERLRAAAQLKNEQNFKGAVGALSSAKALYLAGYGAFAPLADYMERTIGLLRENVWDISADVFSGLYRLREGSAFFVLGCDAADREVLHLARKKGACIIAMCAEEKGGLAEYCDYLLHAEGIAALGLANAVIAALENIYGLSLETIKKELANSRLEYIIDELQKN